MNLKIRVLKCKRKLGVAPGPHRLLRVSIKKTLLHNADSRIVRVQILPRRIRISAREAHGKREKVFSRVSWVENGISEVELSIAEKLNGLS